MFHGSHETYVDSLKRHMKAWKIRGPAGDGSKGPFSDATICDFIVQAHERIGGTAKAGIVFAPGSSDEFNRRKANSVRIMRMLTDEPNTEFESFQLFNFAPSILAAMPQDLAMSFMSEYLAPTGLSPRSAQVTEAVTLDVPTNLCHSIKETAEANQALAELMHGADIEKLQRAQRELVEAVDAETKALKAVEAEIARCTQANIPTNS